MPQQQSPLQNLMYPKQDYAEFTKILLQAYPDAENIVSPQKAVDMYNEVMQKFPKMTMAQIRELLPKILDGILKKIGGGNPSANNLEALQAAGRGQ